MPVASELMVKIGLQDDLSGPLQKSSGQVSNFAKGASALGSVATAAFTVTAAAALTLGAGIGSAIGTAMDFEAAMSSVAAVADGGEGALAALSATAIKLGQDTTLSGVGATDAARAMRELAAAGMSVDDIIGGGALGALRLASAGGLDVARAAEIASNAMNGFGLAGSDATRVADLFAAAANASAIDVNDIGESLKYVAPIAKTMGLSIEDVTATLAAMGNQGIKASQAGTSIRSMISSLAKPSKESQKAMNELGLSFFDASGQMKSLGGISGELKDKLGGLTDQQRAATLVTLFGQEALSAATVLYGEGADGIAAWTDKLLNGTTAAEAGAIRNNNLKGSIEALKSSWETAQIVLGKAFLPALKGMTDQLAAGVSAAIPFIEAFGPRLVAGLTAGITAVVAFGKNVAAGIMAVVGAFQALFSGQINFSQFVGGIQSMVTAVATNLGQLVSRAAPYLQAFLTSIGTFIVSAAPQIATQIGIWAGALTDWITGTAIPFLAPRLGAFLMAINTWVTTIAAPAIGQAMLAVAQGFTSWLTTTAIPFLATNLPLWLQSIATWITGTVLPTLGALFGPVGQAFGRWITGTAIPFLQTNLSLWLTALQTWITGTALPAIAGFVGPIASAFGGWITTTAIPYLTTNLPLWLTALSTWITGTALPAVGTALVAVGTAFGDWVATTAVPWVTANLPGWWAAISTWITSTAIPAAAATLDGLGKALGDWVATSAVPYLQANLPGWSSALATGLTGGLTQINDFSTLAGQKFNEWIKSEDTRSKLEAAGTETDTGLAGILNRINRFSQQAGTDLNAWIQESGPKWLTSWEELARVTAEGAGKINDAMIEMNLQIGQTLNEGLKAIMPEWSHSWDQLGTAVQTAMSNIGTWVQSGLSELGTQFDSWLQSVTPSWTHSWDELGTAVRQALDKMVQAVTSGGTQMSGSMATAMIGVVLSVVSGMAQLVTAVTSGVERAVSALGAMKDRAAAAVGNLGSTLFSAGANLVQGFIDGINSKIGAAVAAAGKLANLVSGGVSKALEEKSPSRVMMRIGEYAGEGLAIGIQDTFGSVADTGRGLVTSLIDGIDAKQADLASKVASAVSAASKAFTDTLSAMTAIASFDFAKNSPSGDQLGWLSHLVTSLVATIQDAAQGFTEKGLKATSEFADAAGKVGGGIKNALDGILALGKANFAASSPTGAALGWFAHLVTSMVATMQEAAAGFDTAGLDAVSKFSDAASKVTGLIKGGVDALAALGKYADPPRAAIYAFGKTLRALINDMALIAEQVTQEATDAAAKFATGAGAAVTLLGNGVGAFAKLVDYADPPRAAIYAFGKTLRTVINDFALLSEQITPAATAAAAIFAEGAGKVVAVLGSGVSGFAALSTYVAPAASAIYDFGKTLRAVINDFSLLAAQITQEATDKAALFAGGVGGVVGIIGSAVEGLSKLATFVAPSQAAIDQFVYAVHAIVAKMADMASNFQGEALAQATAFAVSAKAVFDAAKGGLDVFQGFKDLVIPSAAAIDALVSGIQYVTTRMAQIASEIGAKGLAQAQAFGTGVSAIFGSLKSAIDTMDKLKGFKDNARIVFDALLVGMQDAIDRAQGMVQFAKNLKIEAEEYLANMEAAARLFAQGAAMGGLGGPAAAAGASLGASVAAGARESLDSHSPSQVMASIGHDVIAGLVKGMDEKAQDAAKKAADVASAVAGAIQSTLAALGAVAGFDAAKGPSSAQIGGVLAYTKQLIAAMQQAAGSLSEDGAKAIDTYTKAASTVVDTFGKAADLLGKLGDYVAPSATALYDVGKGLRAAIQDFAALADQLAPELVAAATTFADGAGKVSETIGKAADGFGKLGSFAYDEAVQAGIFGLGKAIRQAVQDFGAIAEVVETQVLANAARFAEGAGKVSDVVAKGAEGFGKLADFAYTAAIRAGIFAFGKAVMQVVGDFGAIADTLGATAIDHAGRFADGAGKVVAIIGNAVDGLTKLGEYKGIANGLIAPFVETVRVLVAAIATASTEFTADALTLAGQFADAAGKAVGILANGVTGFAALDKFRPVALGTIQAFAATVGQLVRVIGDIASGFATEGLDLTGKFVDAAAKATGMLGNGVAGFAALLTFVAPPRVAIDAFLATVEYVMRQFGVMAARMATEGIAQAGAFGTAAGAVMGAAKSGVDAFAGFATLVLPLDGAVDEFLRSVSYMVNRMGEAARATGEEGLQRAQAFASATSAVFGAVKAALDVMGTVAGMATAPANWLDPLLAGLQDAVNRAGQMVQVALSLRSQANDFFQAMQQAAGLFAQGMNLQAQASGGGATYTGPAAMLPPLASSGGGSGGGGGTVQIIFNGPVYGGQDFDARVQQAKVALERQGRW